MLQYSRQFRAAFKPRQAMETVPTLRKPELKVAFLVFVIRFVFLVPNPSASLPLPVLVEINTPRTISSHFVPTKENE